MQIHSKIIKSLNSPIVKLLATAVAWPQFFSASAQNEDTGINELVSVVFHDPIYKLIGLALGKCTGFKSILLYGMELNNNHNLDALCANINQLNSSLIDNEQDYANLGSALKNCVTSLCQNIFPHASNENTQLIGCVENFCTNMMPSDLHIEL